MFKVNAREKSLQFRLEKEEMTLEDSNKLLIQCNKSLRGKITERGKVLKELELEIKQRKEGTWGFDKSVAINHIKYLKGGKCIEKITDKSWFIAFGTKVLKSGIHKWTLEIDEYDV